jgi:nitric oxide dioxygenase
MENPISRHEADLIQSAFHLIDTSSIDFSNLFYQLLFKRKPQLRSIFPSDLTRQKMKFLNTLNIIVNGCMVLHKMEHTIEALGEMHRPFKASPEDYEAVGEALIESLQEHCSKNWSPETAIAWRKIYRYIADIMMSV